MGEFFRLVGEVGFPIASAIAGGYFVFLTLKFILAGVTSSVKSMAGIIGALDKRVAAMNHDVMRIDIQYYQYHQNLNIYSYHHKRCMINLKV